MSVGLRQPVQAAVGRAARAQRAPETGSAPCAAATGYRIILLVLYASGMAAWTWAGLNQDVAWMLNVADRVHDGARLYVDIREVNPPLVVWLMSIPAALARTSGMSQLSAVNLLALAVVVVGALLTAMVLRRLPELAEREVRTMVLALVGVSMLFPGADVAQREHLIVPLITPYLCLLVATSRGVQVSGALRVVVGAWAAVGFSLKPHYVLLWGGLELVLMLRRRSPRTVARPESLAVVALGALYGLALLRFAPVYLEFARTWGALYLDFNRRSWPSLILAPEMLVIGAALALALWRRRVDRSAGGALTVILALAAGAFVLTFVLQAKGWTYHRLPMMAFAAMSLLLFASSTHWPSRMYLSVQQRMLLRATAVVGVAVLLLLQVRVGISSIMVRRGLTHELLPLLVEYGPAPRLAAFTPGIAPAFPLVNESGAVWDARNAHAWALWTLYHRECAPGSAATSDGDDGALLARAYDEAVRDLALARPDVVLVSDAGVGGAARPGCRTFAEFLLRDPRLAAVLQTFRMREHIRGFRVLTR